MRRPNDIMAPITGQAPVARWNRWSLWRINESLTMTNERIIYSATRRPLHCRAWNDLLTTSCQCVNIKPHWNPFTNYQHVNLLRHCNFLVLTINSGDGNKTAFIKRVHTIAALKRRWSILTEPVTAIEEACQECVEWGEYWPLLLDMCLMYIHKQNVAGHNTCSFVEEEQ